jgi:CBS domain-containing protein
MQVKDIMSKNVECISPHKTLEEAAFEMCDLNIGSLPVCGDNDRLAGIITDRDIVVRAVAKGLDPRTVKVSEAMTKGIAYCFEDQNIGEAAMLMEEKQIRRLAVLNDSKRLVGIISLGDIAVETGDERLAGEALERVSEHV